MENKIMWKPSDQRSRASNLTAFLGFLRDREDAVLETYDGLQSWSVSHQEEFWNAVWDFTGIISSRQAQTALVNGRQFPGAEWFQGARLNFAENLLWRRDDKPALVELLESGARRSLTYSELYHQVALLAAGLKSAGVSKGDRVAGLMPNIMETVVAMLATTSLGAIWSSCSPDFGGDAALDRFGQISPKVLFTVDKYVYNGKTIDCYAKGEYLAASISSIQRLVVVTLDDELTNTCDFQGPKALPYAQFLSNGTAEDLSFTQLPFDHPLYIMYSSGTTGAPKCIVHGAGGTLLQHKKEHVLHCDLSAEDVLFYFTTCGWMMWNWLVSGLASGATLLLYDGSPFAHDGDILLDAIDAEGVTIFGVGAKYIASLEKSGKKPRETHRLASLKTILSTGSPLGSSSFDYIYRDFKADVCLSSISGGTDILSCFVLGNPVLPVIRGEIQCIGLGMAVEIWDDTGKSIKESKGELVCVKPFPSTPIGFWNDPDGSRFRKAYFEKYEGVWAHGDFGEVTASNGIIIHGRSDAVLNPGGVRIGTAEIYRQVERVGCVLDSVVVGQQWGDDERVVLFVVLREGLELSDEIRLDIRQRIRENATPRHLPAVIIQVPDIPRTISGKISELAVKKVIHGESAGNADALANPEALNYFRSLPDLRI